MARPLFFDEKYFFTVTSVDENVNYKKLQPVIWDCQELYIQDVLGTPLYNDLKDGVVNTNLTSDEQTLLEDYVVPCLINYVMMESQLPLLYKMRNKSVNTDRSDFSDPVSIEQHKYIVDQYRMKAEKYAEKIEAFLCANSTTYPKYTTYTQSDEVRAQGQRPTVPIYLGMPGSKGRGWEYYEKE